MRLGLLIILASALPAFTFATRHKHYYECQYLQGRIPLENVRYSTLLQAMKLLSERNAQVIIETGTSRYGSSNCLGDGCSTLIFGDWVRQNGGVFYSVDIDELAIERAVQGLGASSEIVHFINSDSVAFLKNFGRPIDFLYLDSYDFEEFNPNPSQQHHLNEVIAAYPWLTKNSVIMIDDCKLPHGGKGKLAIEYLLGRGWRILMQSYQTILAQD